MNQPELNYAEIEFIQLQAVPGVAVVYARHAAAIMALTQGVEVRVNHNDKTFVAYPASILDTVQEAKREATKAS